MKITEGPLTGLLIIEPRIFTDSRGYFYEVFQQQRYQEHGIPAFVQDNVSRSRYGVLRGLHYQLPHPQGKLVYVTRGSVWDVAVDIRVSSPTFGQWFGAHLNDENHKQIYIPPGFAHGFCVLSEEADFHYKCTDYYFPGTEQGIAWNDKRLNIPWLVHNPVLSPKDEILPGLNDITHAKLFP
ncbi:dTDP-4-dehydrorhamnose 3,5-epimerase [Aquicella siphonis]|uniref:dTDP-4-dehydrorhamnose 3,5-epimerase n=1 Tax=Aquicella siphonis TaxID=254247 RepID=A0A5E4PIP7_9COXI|nr:dTDP-4-dehydrorhamnose 3,5-epimerase [Aquicella siphonis]VVC76328.1 dTDP-4-dehydrorhamnose 3,5-epimerase [Aquicella siphonis]